VTDALPTAAQVSAFVSCWRSASGSERANYQLFVGELCALLDWPTPAIEPVKPRRASTIASSAGGPTIWELCRR